MKANCQYLFGSISGCFDILHCSVFFKIICSSLNNKKTHIVPVIEKNYSSGFIFYFEFFLVYASSIYSFYLHMILKYPNCDRFLILVVMPYNLGIM